MAKKKRTKRAKRKTQANIAWVQKKKPAKSSPQGGAKKGKKAPAKRTSEEELAILEQLFLLNGGTLLDFRPVAPPPSVRGVIRRANLHQLQGALVEVLTALRAHR